MKQHKFLTLFLKNIINDTLFIPEIERKIINFAVICGYLANSIGPHALAGGRRRAGTGPEIQNNGYGRQATGHQTVRSGSRDAGATKREMPDGHADTETTDSTRPAARIIRPGNKKRPRSGRRSADCDIKVSSCPKKIQIKI